MSLKLYSHPLASYCHKVLIALYENRTPFEPVHVDLGNAQSRAAFVAVWPTGKMPVLVDERLGRTVPESSVMIEYLEQHYPGPVPLLPHDRDAQLNVRLWDRLLDSYVMSPMQSIVAQQLRSETQRDALVTSSSRETLDMAYELVERQLADNVWAAGDAFTMADCAAAPALFYASIVHPFPASCRRLAEYHERLMARPSVARVLKEARPYFELFPLKKDIPARFLHD
ncbi:glutathione S-transferase family protein [Steroidobacter sp. S1-65]|uniref:Glutathione S-transferase family protein n=1 Tax=Steroidobacter gossypii TaxID=2805490 RepID=A0ABS1WZN4_9GAMM|nr:glutathione S-transferase family protein [Steroidobacter gossypii]MBM0106444.1 glutathione S-transferase family protein [Steroidobacter gossypii]